MAVAHIYPRTHPPVRSPQWSASASALLSAELGTSSAQLEAALAAEARLALAPPPPLVQCLRERVASIERWERRAMTAMEASSTTGRLNELSTILAFASKRCNLPSSEPAVRALTRAIAAGERWHANLTSAFTRRVRKSEVALSAAEKRLAARGPSNAKSMLAMLQRLGERDPYVPLPPPLVSLSLSLTL